MSNAMRKGKRTLAGVAAGALGLALIPFVGVGAANAAVPVGTVTSVTGPDASRIDTDFTLTIVGTGLTTTANTEICSTVISGPAGATYTATETAPSSATAGTTVAQTDTAGNYTLGIYLIDGTANDCSDAAPGAAGVATAILNQVSIVVGGPIASFSVSPATASAPTNTAVTYELSAVDANGRPTVFGSGDTYTLSSATATVTTTPAKATPGQTAMSFDAENSAAGTASVVVTASNAGLTAQTVSLTTVAPATVTEVALTDSETISQSAAAGGGTPGAAIAKPGVTSFNFAITGTANGTAFVSSVNTGTATGATSASSVPLNADGEGTLTVSVPTAQAIDANTVIIDMEGLADDYTVTYEAADPASATVERSNPASAQSTVAVPTGTTVTVTVDADDQYGAGFANWIITATSDVTGASAVSATSGASGSVNLALPDLSTSADTSVAWTFAAVFPATGTTATPSALTIEYYSATDVTASDLAFDGTAVADYTLTPGVPFSGALGAAPVAANGDENFIEVTVTVSQPNTQVTFTGTEGTLFATSGVGVNLDVVESAASLTTFADSNGDATAYVYSTATGAQTITATSVSGSAVSGSVTYVNDAAAARNVELVAASQRPAVGTATQVTVTVTDAFGNAVVLDGGGEQVVLQTDLGSLAGGSSVFPIQVTNSLGQATVTLFSSVAGIATVTAVGTGGGQFGDDADVPTNSGFAASVDRAAVPVEFGSAITPSIIIEGDREGRRIVVVGETQGIAEGTIVRPWIRFPGETSYNLGTAQRSVAIIDAEDEIGEFAWGRKTGKRTAVIFRTQDQSVSSTRVIIPAR